ncbi:DUF924 family protein [Luteimonas terricola]|uniref:DUF924 domain-containing protein n=1 Tax=Luteimonas terricola TaxID=645597 RepID=A0ABQ2EK28_9GAMM|nr:DUF924 family protein [Luteimonas terricola]GGK14926.1 hypothetical protein GCM10011394_25160 [Luteimonas terricola]
MSAVHGLPTAREIVAFWREAGPPKWFNGGAAFDEEVRQFLEGAHFAAARRELEAWVDDADGALAVQILLDQVPRNIFRGSAHSYATDPLALHYAERMLESGLDREVDPELRVFCYMPFEHSEVMADQERAVALMADLGETYLGYAVRHLEVIERFGRFPHRNHALGRASSADEQAWLDAGGGF